MRTNGMKKRTLSLTMAFIICLSLLTSTATPVTAQPLDSEFGLWVGGTPVTKENIADITATSPAVSAGKAEYDTGCNTLILTDFRCENLSDDGSLKGVIHYTGTNPLTIKLVGANTVTASGGSVTCGIYSEGPLVITGNGSLTATGASGAFEKSCGVCFARSLEIKSGTVTAAGGNTETFTGENGISCGLYGTSGIVLIKKATVNARGGQTNCKSGSLSAGITGGCIAILGGTVSAYGAAGSASYGLDAHMAPASWTDGLAEQAEIVTSYLEAERIAREAAAQNEMVLTSSNYFNKNAARGLAEEMLKYKLLQDGMVNAENLRNVKIEWVGNQYESKYALVQYLDTNKKYHEEYYDYVTCDPEGNSLFRWEIPRVTVHGSKVEGDEYALNVGGINVLRKNVKFTDQVLLKDAGTAREREFLYSVYYTENGVRTLYQGQRYVSYIESENGHYKGYDYYTVNDYEWDVELRGEAGGIIVGDKAVSVDALSADTTAVCGEVRNDIGGTGWTSAGAVPEGIGESAKREIATPYQRIVFGNVPASKSFTVDDIAGQAYTGSAVTPDVTVRDGSDADKLLTPGTDYTVEYSNNVNATTTQNAKATVTGLGSYYAYSADKEFTISPAFVTVTAISAEKTYDGTELTADSCTCAGLIEGDSIFSVNVYGSQTDVGSCENVPGNVVIKNSGGEDVTLNYDVSYVNGTLKVSPAAVTVSADDKTKYANDNDPELTATVTGLFGTDTVDYTLSRAAGETPGAYAITPAGVAEQGNYYIVAFVPGTLTITEKPTQAAINNGSSSSDDDDDRTPAAPAQTETRFDTVDPSKGGSQENFKETRAYTEGMFGDVDPSAWYSDNVAAAVEYGLMEGYGSGKFGVGEPLKINEALAIACRLHNIYYGGSGIFDQTKDKNWYQVYDDYAVRYGIIENGQYDLTAPATRAVFAEIISAALPDEALLPINNVTALPDMDSDDPRLSAILRLYNAGILNGVDPQGSFDPDNLILREQIAAIATRVADPSMRTIE